MSSSQAISPTAHYTGYVWARAGLSHPELATLQGRLLFDSLRPLMSASSALGGASLEAYLLARHRAIDLVLERAIEDRSITQVIEVACGLSPRGWRFSQRYGAQLTYVEADLPDMAERKRRALSRIGSLGAQHRVESVDALLEAGPDSVAALAEALDSRKGVAIITEGLLGYLDRASVDGLWRRFVVALEAFPNGLYVSDLHIGGVQSAQVKAFAVVLSAFVRGRVHLHFQRPAEAEAALTQAGFAAAQVRRASTILGETRGRGSALAHILQASI